MSKTEEKPRRSTGLPQDPSDSYLPNGKPNLMPTAGYENTKPVQYSDETDAQYTLRLKDWEIRYAHAKDIANGGASKESKIAVLDAQYELDKAAIDNEIGVDEKFDVDGNKIK